MRTYKFSINGNIYEVEIKEFVQNGATIEVNGTQYFVELQHEVVKTKTPTLVRPEVPPTGGRIEKRGKGDPIPVIAPLPGTIIEVYVKPGDMIKKGQDLLMMEAMKMENRIQADREGVIEKVRVIPGENVLQGDVLIELV